MQFSAQLQTTQFLSAWQVESWIVSLGPQSGGLAGQGPGNGSLNNQARVRVRANGHGLPNLSLLSQTLWVPELRAGVMQHVCLLVCGKMCHRMCDLSRVQTDFSCSEGCAQLQTPLFHSGWQAECWEVPQGSPIWRV